MTTKTNIPPSVWIDEMDLAGGKSWLKEIYTPAQGYDNAQFFFWQNYLTNLAISAFEWVNMPAGIDTRAVEYILLNFGMGALFEEQGGALFAQAMPADNINMFYNPNKITLVSPAGQTWQRHCNYYTVGDDVMPRDAVMCFDNMMRLPLTSFIRNYARRLAQIDRTIDVNIGAQQTPWIITGPEEAKSTKKNIVKKLKNHDQFISQNSDMGSVITYEVLNTQAPYVADKLQDLKKRILDEAVTFFGADNANTDKRERVNTQEVLSNNEQIMLMRYSRLKCRKEFCRYVNTVFGHLLNEPLDVHWSIPHVKEQEAAVPTMPGLEDEA